LASGTGGKLSRPPTESILFLPGGRLQSGPEYMGNKTYHMNYYKLYPVEYKNSIFLVIALSLSPDKRMA